MNVTLNGVSNPGWSFKEHRIKQLNEMLKWMINYNSNESISYKELQRRLEAEDNSLDKSKIRMLFPWLQNYGILKSYKEDFIPSDLFTKFGVQFTVFIDIYLEIINYKHKSLYQVSENLLKEFLFQSYLNLLEKDDEEKNIYLQVLVFLEEFKELSNTEFYLITTGIEDTEKGLQWAREMIEHNRSSNLITSGPDKNKNAWGYITPFLEEADLVIKADDIIYPKKNSNYQKLISGGVI